MYSTYMYTRPYFVAKNCVNPNTKRNSCKCHDDSNVTTEDVTFE